MAVGMGAVTVKAPVAVVPFAVAEMVTDVLVWTAIVVTVKVAVVAPPATVTVAGTTPAGPLDERVTVYPAAGAGEPSVSVPVVLVPPTTVAGEYVIPSGNGALTVKVAEAELVP